MVNYQEKSASKLLITFFGVLVKREKYSNENGFNNEMVPGETGATLDLSVLTLSHTSKHSFSFSVNKFKPTFAKTFRFLLFKVVS